IPPNASCTINVTFTPTAVGSRTATLTIQHNAPSGPQTVALSGNGTSASGLVITPRAVALTFTQTQQFTTGANVFWSVDGIVGGSVSSGTITATGVYTPPNSSGIHTVTATTTDQAQSVNATVYVNNYPGKFTHNNDNLRTGQNLNEIALTPT